MKYTYMFIIEIKGQNMLPTLLHDLRILQMKLETEVNCDLEIPVEIELYQIKCKITPVVEYSGAQL